MSFIVTPGHLDEFFRLKDEASDASEIVQLIQDFLDDPEPWSSTTRRWSTRVRSSTTS